jgi:hypothetical protein
MRPGRATGATFGILLGLGLACTGGGDLPRRPRAPYIVVVCDLCPDPARPTLAVGQAIQLRAIYVDSLGDTTTLTTRTYRAGARP